MSLAKTLSQTRMPLINGIGAIPAVGFSIRFNAVVKTSIPGFVPRSE